MDHSKVPFLVDAIAAEADFLVSTILPYDAFLLDVAKKMRNCQINEYQLQGGQLQTFQLLGMAAIRSLDTFDDIPEARKFLDLTATLSSILADRKEDLNC